MQIYCTKCPEEVMDSNQNIKNRKERAEQKEITKKERIKNKERIKYQRRDISDETAKRGERKKYITE